MARGEYGPFVGNGVNKLPQATGFYRSYAVVFRERVAELDAAIQQADRDYATKYQTSWDVKPGEPGLDQSHFVFTYWLPFVKAWNAARAWLLAGTMDRAAALALLSWAGRFNDLKMDAGASWGLSTDAPSVMIKGEPPADAGRPTQAVPWWKDWRFWAKAGVGAAIVGGVYYWHGTIRVPRY